MLQNSIHLPNVLVSLQVPELGHGVVAKSLVQRTVTKLVPNVHTSTLLHKQLKQETHGIIHNVKHSIFCSPK